MPKKTTPKTVEEPQVSFEESLAAIKYAALDDAVNAYFQNRQRTPENTELFNVFMELRGYQEIRVDEAIDGNWELLTRSLLPIKSLVHHMGAMYYLKIADSPQIKKIQAWDTLYAKPVHQEEVPITESAVELDDEPTSVDAGGEESGG